MDESTRHYHRHELGTTQEIESGSAQNRFVNLYGSELSEDGNSVYTWLSKLPGATLNMKMLYFLFGGFLCLVSLFRSALGTLSHCQFTERFAYYSCFAQREPYRLRAPSTPGDGLQRVLLRGLLFLSLFSRFRVTTLRAYTCTFAQEALQ